MQTSLIMKTCAIIIRLTILYYLGRFLQIVGLVGVLLGFLLGVAYNSERLELIYLGIGLAVFVVGTLCLKPFKK